MPWHIDANHPKCAGFAVVKDSDNSVAGCHKTKAEAMAQLAALNINVKEVHVELKAPPRENLYRAVSSGPELREAEGGMPTMVGHFAVFNQWTPIESIFEGRFLESIAPGAFAKTFDDNRAEMRVLFQHGRDPQIGDKPLGPIDQLKEDSVGADYEVPLLDTSYTRDLIPGLEANLYGASFRFRVMREEFTEEPKKSAYNPEGWPERVIKEARVFEFGPVTFPAYSGATAGVRSITDEILFGRLILESDPEQLRRYVDFVKSTEREVITEDAPSTSDAGPAPTSEPERRVTVPRKRIDYLSRREPTWKL